jgi:hypothetical protein
MDKNDVLRSISDELGLTITEHNFTKARLLLAERLNELLNSDFQKLISILYRLDISEPKLKSLLNENPEIDAGLIIADMMIDREEQKRKSRSQFKQRDNNISDEEKW